MKEREWKARIPPPLTGERPVCTARYMAILLSFKLFPFVATSVFHPGPRYARRNIIRHGLPHSFGLLYSAIFPFRIWLRFELAPFHGRRIRIYEWFFGSLFHIILYIIPQARHENTNNNCCTINGSLFYELLGEFRECTPDS